MITTSQANLEWYNENVESRKIQGELKDTFICKNCGHEEEDESNVYYEKDNPFCCKECSLEFEQYLKAKNSMKWMLKESIYRTKVSKHFNDTLPKRCVDKK